MRRVIVPLLALLFVIGCGSGSEQTANPYGLTAPSNKTPIDITSVVLYEVEGTTDYASVTVSTPDGTRQLNPDVPMTRKSGERGLELRYESGDFVYISAQNKRGHGTVSCRISIDGVPVSENESSGGYAIATCEGTVP